VLKLADNLELPLDVVTEKLAWLGRTGSGKTYGAMKLAELMLDAGAQIGALDPVGVWRGLRVPAQKDGRSYDVVVFGGLYGDLPLQPTAGALIADVVCDRGISFVLDVSQFVPSEQQRFGKAFAERFFQRRKAAPAAVHLFMEECQEFLPQNPMGSEAETLHEFQRLWKIGRNFGIGGSLISQRPQEVNKKALNMSGTLFAFQMMAPQERKAVKEWVADHGVGEEIIGTLQKLNVGEPHIESPMFLQVSETIRILPRITADLSSTPKVGSSKAATRPLTPIDVEQLKSAMADSIETSKANDPRELKKTIAELRKQLGSKQVVTVSNQVVSKPPKVIERLVLKDAQIARFEKAIERVGELQTGFTPKLLAVYEPLTAACADILTAIRRTHATQAAAVHARVVRESGAHSGRRGEIPSARRAPVVPQARRDVDVRGRELAAGAAADNGYLPPGEKATLIAAAQYADGVNRKRLGVLTGYKRSSRNTYVQRLQAMGYVVAEGDLIRATDAGITALGADYKRLPTGEELQQYWLARLTGGERAILEATIAAYPQSVDREALSETTGYTRSSRNTYIQRLQARQLLGKGGGPITASAVLFDE
jgi:hypothetical protein